VSNAPKRKTSGYATDKIAQTSKDTTHPMPVDFHTEGVITTVTMSDGLDLYYVRIGDALYGFWDSATLKVDQGVVTWGLCKR
jgi:hypothetical protein